MSIHFEALRTKKQVQAIKKAKKKQIIGEWIIGPNTWRADWIIASGFDYHLLIWRDR